MNQQENESSELLLRERCLAYLLGEMTSGQAAAFESELDDPKVSAAMERESELLVCLASTNRLSAPVGPSRDPEDASDEAASTKDSDAFTLQAVVRFISALAAILVLSLGYTLYSVSFDDDQATGPTIALSDNQLVLAKHLVEPPIEWNWNDEADFAEAGEVVEEDNFDEPDEQGSLDWMVAAFEASIQEESSRNDG